MIKFENVEIGGIRPAIRGMRNPKNSWERSDSRMFEGDYMVGPNDKGLMSSLASAGPVHAKYRRMIVVWVDITAPLYWWKEFDTYKVGTVANSCSTMHKIADKEFAWEDFSTEHLIRCRDCSLGDIAPTLVMDSVINALNVYRKKYLDTKDKKYWWQMIQLLPSSYNQKRTIMMSYEVLANIYHNGRRTHKLDEWRQFCEWAEKLDYSEFFTGEVGSEKSGVTFHVKKENIDPDGLEFLSHVLKAGGLSIGFDDKSPNEIRALLNQPAIDEVYKNEIRKKKELGGNKNDG